MKDLVDAMKKLVDEADDQEDDHISADVLLMRAMTWLAEELDAWGNEPAQYKPSVEQMIEHFKELHKWYA